MTTAKTKPEKASILALACCALIGRIRLSNHPTLRYNYGCDIFSSPFVMDPFSTLIMRVRAEIGFARIIRKGFGGIGPRARANLRLWNACGRLDREEALAAIMDGADPEGGELTTGCSFLAKAAGTDEFIHFRENDEIAFENFKAIAMALVDKGAIPDRCLDRSGNTALHAAISAGFHERATTLVSLGASIDAKGASGESAADICLNGQTPAIRMLAAEIVARLECSEMERDCTDVVLAGADNESGDPTDGLASNRGKSTQRHKTV